MKKLSDLSTFRQGILSMYTSLFWNRNVNREIKRKSKQFRAQYLYDYENRIEKNILRLGFENFKDSSCLVRWGEVSDREFGGSSTCQLAYNQYLRSLILKGNINMKDRQKLQTMPFIGMIQRIPFRIKMGIFNCIRVTMMTDGKPLSCEIEVESPIYGDRSATAVILPKKSEQWITYELPWRNFQIRGSEILSKEEVFDKSRHRMNQIIDQECLNSDNFCIRNISFRFAGTQDMQRNASFKKIDFVYTMRGTQEYEKDYQRPYFYIVDDFQEKDRLLDELDIGHMILNKKKK